jgi:glycosyltransferase involved in cell wall biosynthesis
MTQQCVALLGRRDKPTDALEEYCKYLGEALVLQGFEMQIARVAWDEVGWPAAIADLKSRASEWRGCWIFLQYTALSWSERGFPARFLRISKILQKNGARVAVVFHDAEPFGGKRLIDWLRRRSQLRVMRAAQKRSLAVFTVPMNVISWRPYHKHRHAFIPVGANFPDSAVIAKRKSLASGDKLTIAVYGVTGGSNGEKELRDIAEAVRFAAQNVRALRLVVLGRNSEAAEKALREALRDVPVALHVLGVLQAEEVAVVLCHADVLLFVRGEISTRRSSAIAGIACGLPVVAFTGGETAPPITEAGLAIYSRKTAGDLSRVLAKVLAEPEYRAALAVQSREAHEKYFSWKAIAGRYSELLREIP